jgi:hypothetical protein
VHINILLDCFLIMHNKVLFLFVGSFCNLGGSYLFCSDHVLLEGGN